MFEAKIIADSISPKGYRLTSFQITYPRIILAEINTHRMLSRNTESSRARPLKDMLAQVTQNPFVPDRFPLKGFGMQPFAYVCDNDTHEGELCVVNQTEFDNWTERIPHYSEMKLCWMDASLQAILHAERLRDLGVHKEIANRLLEPWMWTTTVISGTEWDNVWAQGCHPAAQRQFQILAGMMFRAYRESVPKSVGYGKWHLPYIEEDDWTELSESFADPKELTEIIKRLSVARTAAVSYHRHGERRGLEKALEVFERMTAAGGDDRPGHWSPLEHIASPAHSFHDGEEEEFEYKPSNFHGWNQFRKAFAYENWRTTPAWVQENVNA